MGNTLEVVVGMDDGPEEGLKNGDKDGTKEGMEDGDEEEVGDEVGGKVNTASGLMSTCNAEGQYIAFANKMDAGS